VRKGRKEASVKEKVKKERKKGGSSCMEKKKGKKGQNMEGKRTRKSQIFTCLKQGVLCKKDKKRKRKGGNEEEESVRANRQEGKEGRLTPISEAQKRVRKPVHQEAGKGEEKRIEREKGGKKNRKKKGRGNEQEGNAGK